MQLDPIKPTVKAPGSNLLTLKCDGLLSNFDFKFELRRCNKETFLQLAQVERELTAVEVGRVSPHYLLTVCSSLSAHRPLTVCSLCIWHLTVCS